MADFNREGLRAAAERFARAMRVVAGVRTRHTSEAVNTSIGPDEAIIRGGHPGGAWGWEPIQGLMFDDNRRHPLFGNRKHWYRQGRWPITAYTIRAAGDEAAEAYARAAVDPMLAEDGFK